jgi:hypothetical protein
MNKKQIATNQMNLNLAVMKKKMRRLGRMVRLKYPLTMAIINSVLKGQEILVKQIKIILREDSQLLNILRSYPFNQTNQTIE